MKSAHFDDDAIISLINDVDLNSCVFSVSDQLQDFVPHLIIAGKATFIGPVTISSINDEDFRGFIDNTVSRHKDFSASSLHLHEVELKNGLKISRIINDREIEELLDSGIHSPKLQDLMALISNVKKQEMTVDARKLSSSRMMYLDTDNDIRIQYKMVGSSIEESCESTDEIDFEAHGRGFLVSRRRNVSFELPSIKVEISQICNESRTELRWNYANEEVKFDQSLNIAADNVHVTDTTCGNIYLIMKKSSEIVLFKLKKSTNTWIEQLPVDLADIRIFSIIKSASHDVFLVTSQQHSNEDVLIFKLNENLDRFEEVQRISATTKFDIMLSLNVNSSTFLILTQSGDRKLFIYRLQSDTQRFIFQQILDDMHEEIINVIALHINNEPFIVVSKKSGIFCFYQWRGIENWQIKHCGKFENLKHMKSFQHLNEQRIFLASGVSLNAENSISALIIHRQGDS